MLGQIEENASLIFSRFPANDQAVTLQAFEHTAHAGFENTSLMCQLVTFQFALLAQDSNDSPLLLGQVMIVQTRTENVITASRAWSKVSVKEGLGLDILNGLCE